MSPKIGLSIRLHADKRTPRLKVMAAVAEARAKDQPLRCGETGVMLGRLSGEWVVNRATIVRGIDVIGAVLLNLQPPASADEDHGAVAARALGVSLAWAEGLADGWLRVPMSTFWIGAPVHVQHYTNGYLVGVETIISATLVCGACGALRFKGIANCKTCDR